MICSDSPGQISIFYCSSMTIYHCHHISSFIIIYLKLRKIPQIHLVGHLLRGFPLIIHILLSTTKLSVKRKSDFVTFSITKLSVNKEKWFCNFSLLQLRKPIIYFFLSLQNNFSDRFWNLAFLMDLNIKMAIVVLLVGYITFFRLNDQLFGFNIIRKLNIRTICEKDQDNLRKQIIQIIP